MGYYGKAINVLCKIAEMDLNHNGDNSENIRYTYERIANIYLLMEDTSNIEKYSYMAIDNNNLKGNFDKKLRKKEV